MKPSLFSFLSSHFPRKKQNGFTLLEVLIALTILTGVIITVSLTWSGNFHRLRKINLANNVAILLERKMIEVESKYKGQPVSNIPEEESGDFGASLPNYSWKVTTQKFHMPDLSAILSSQKDGTDEMLLTMIKQLGEFVNKAVKEVTVSVVVKVGNKSVTYDATTYFVDWEQDLPLPGGGGGTSPESTPSGAQDKGKTPPPPPPGGTKP